MKINPSIFKSYDIRGIYPTDINKENFSQIIKAIYIFFTRKLKREKITVVVSRDMRLSSPILAEIAKKTLFNLGATVIDIGLSSTPTMYFSVLNYNYDAGLQISASHNPKEFNGIKFVIRKGNELIKIAKNSGMQDVKEIASKPILSRSKQNGKLIKKDNVLKDELNFSLKKIKLAPPIKKIKIVVDPANSMGILYLSEIFKEIPTNLIKINFVLDGTFPSHHPDPLQVKNLVDLQKKVIDEKADLGISTDGDGDRVFFIDEKGAIIPSTLITSLIAKELLKEKINQKIMADIRYINNVKNVCKNLKGKFIICNVGHALITNLLNKEKAVFAGESSGHYYFGDVGGAESAIRVILYVLSSIYKDKKPISQIVSQLRSSIESGEFNYVLNPGVDPLKVMQSIVKQYHDGNISWFDGLAVSYPDWRFSIRSSGTESLLRLNVEGVAQNIVKKKLEQLKRSIISFGAKEKE